MRCARRRSGTGTASTSVLVTMLDTPEVYVRSVRRMHCSLAETSDQKEVMGMQERKRERMQAAKVMAQIPWVMRR